MNNSGNLEIIRGLFPDEMSFREAVACYTAGKLGSCCYEKYAFLLDNIIELRREYPIIVKCFPEIRLDLDWLLANIRKYQLLYSEETFTIHMSDAIQYSAITFARDTGQPIAYEYESNNICAGVDVRMRQKEWKVRQVVTSDYNGEQLPLLVNWENFTLCRVVTNKGFNKEELAKFHAVLKPRLLFQPIYAAVCNHWACKAYPLPPLKHTHVQTIMTDEKSKAELVVMVRLTRKNDHIQKSRTHTLLSHRKAKI